MYGGRYGANRLNLFYRDEEQTRKLLHDYLAMREREVDGVCAIGRPASPSPEFTPSPSGISRIPGEGEGRVGTNPIPYTPAPMRALSSITS